MTIFDYSGDVPVYSGQFRARASAIDKRCNMKTISRKELSQAIDTIQAKGLKSAMGIKKSGASRKQLAFAEKVVLDGMNASQAYRASYNTKAKASTVNVEAHKLMKNPKVANTILALEEAKQSVASHTAESLRALCVSTLVDVATNSDRDAVRVAAVRVLGSVVGVDAYRETKRIETVKDSDEIKTQIMQQLKTMMLGTDSAVEVDANDLLSELTGSDPTHAPPPETSDGTPADHVHTIPLEQSQSFSDEIEQPIKSTEPTPMPLESAPTPGDIFLENPDGCQDATGRVSTLKVKS